MHERDKVHLVGSVAMDNCDQVFRRLAETVGPYVRGLPDGETGERARWIYFQRTMLTEHPAMEIDPTVPELELHQWDGKLLRSLPLLRFRNGVDPATVQFVTGYDRAAEYSYGVFRELRGAGVIPEDVRFQVCLPTPMASGYMYVSPKAHDQYHAVYERSLLQALDNITRLIPHGDLAVQYDVCQEVLIFEDYFPYRPDDYRERIFAMLGRLGDTVPTGAALGYHLCYGTPYDEHLVMPKDMGILVDLINGIGAHLARRLDFIHVPVPKRRTDAAYFAPLQAARLRDETHLYLGLIHHDDEQGDQQRIAAARKFIDEFGVATECGWGRSDSAKVPALLASHCKAAIGL